MIFTRTLAAAALTGACAIACAAAAEPAVTQTTRDARMAAALQDYQTQKSNAATPSPAMQRQQPRMKHHNMARTKKEGATASAPK